MTIAVSAVVRPSRILLSLTLGMCAGSASIGTLFALQPVASMAPLARVALATACVMAGLIVACQILRCRCAQRIEISGNGQIRVSTPDASPSTSSELSDRFVGAARLYDLLPTSTLWSHLMILNLRAANGTRTTLLILPDSMTQTSFRALSVACHWIAAHNNRAERDIK